MPVSPHPPQRLRRLAAMGIDVYVRRELLLQEASVDSPDDAPEDSGVMARGGATAAPVPGPPEMAREASLAGARALLEAHAEVSAAPEGGDTAATPPERSPAEPGRAATASVESQEAPRFRLTALRAGAGLLLVDEALLPEERRDVLSRLGDLLRAGLLQRDAQGAPAKRMETQAFFWPQVEAGHIDQSMPQAVEALGAWVRRCTADGEGCLIVIAAAPDSPAATPLRALETLPVRRALIDASFVTAPDGASHRAAWRALAALGPGREKT